jgi:four helix bundle protein
MSINSVSDLVVWNRSMELAKNVYELVAHLPSDERFGLTSQLRRAAVSIPSNVAEGWGYGRTGKYVHHLRLARGSGCELNTQLELSERLGLLRSEQVAPILHQANEVGRMLSGPIRSLEQREPNS